MSEESTNWMKYCRVAIAYHDGSSFGRFPHPTPPFDLPTTNQQDFQDPAVQNPQLLQLGLLDRPFIDVLSRRVSTRNFAEGELSLDKLTTILWAGFGVCECDTSRHNSPSAGALYGVGATLYVRRVEGLKPGVFQYCSASNALHKLDRPIVEIEDCFHTKHIDYSKATAVVFFVGNIQATCAKYGDRGYRYLLLEAGHIAQNMSLAATACEVPHIHIGGFDDDTVNSNLILEEAKVVVYSMVLGS